MPTQSQDSAITISLKKHREDERVRDILLAVEQLFHREENAVAFVLSCLYDIGSVNLIEKKVPIASLKPVLRSIARYSRPAFRFVAVRWFHQNCPKLITDWLHSLVIFEPSESESLGAIDVSAQRPEIELALAIQQKQNEVVQLQQQLHQTTVLAVTIAALFGSATLWLGYELQQVRTSSSTAVSQTAESRATP